MYFDRVIKYRHQEIVLVEGINDAALAQSLGLTNVCAYVGAYCSNEQIQTLKRKGITKIILCGDPDTAGDNGTASNLKRILQVGIPVYIAPRLPNNLDPDEFMLQNGVEAWKEHIDNCEHGFRWQAKRFINQCGTDSDKAIAELIKLAFDWANTVPSSMQKELETFFWSEINKQIGAINPEQIERFLAKFKSGDEPETQPRSLTEGKVSSPEQNKTKYLTQELSKLILHGATEADLEAIIPELAKKCDRSSNDVRRLFRALEKQLGQEENLVFFDAEINSLHKMSQEDIKLGAYIPQELATQLELLAVYLGVNNSSSLTTLLTISASLLPIDTKLELIRVTDFNAYPILYACICAESGSGKSPLFKALLQPLFRLQEEEDKQYERKLKAYNEAYQLWKKSKDIETEAPIKPKLPREYIVTDATSEAIANIQNNQPNNGFLGWYDELVALIKQLNVYRGGKGADAEKLLSGRDGSGFKINRAGGTRINCMRSGYSILGGIQPDILKEQMRDCSDPSGFWARFIWVDLPIIKKKFPEGQASLNLNQSLYLLYRKLETVESTFKLSSDASAAFKEWYERAEDLKITEPKQAFRAVYAKSQRLAGEIALLLHSIKYCFCQQQPPEEVQLEVMQAAVELTKFYINQAKLIHANSSTSNDSLPSIYFKIIALSHRKGWLKARDVQNGIRYFKKENSSQIRAIFRELESRGHGKTQFDGNKLVWTVKSVDAVDNL